MELQAATRPKPIAPGAKNAALADLRIVLTGGRARVRSTATIKVTLSCPPSGGETPQLVAGTVRFQGRRNRDGYTFDNVVFTEPGPTVRRVFRITNLRGNASGVGPGGLGVPGQIVAFVTFTPKGSTALPAGNAGQVVGLSAAAANAG